jgi:hypothetical protein
VQSAWLSTLAVAIQSVTHQILSRSTCGQQITFNTNKEPPLEHLTVQYIVPEGRPQHQPLRSVYITDGRVWAIGTESILPVSYLNGHGMQSPSSNGMGFNVRNTFDIFKIGKNAMPIN